MPLNLFNKKEHAFGLDISADSLKLFEFGEKGGGLFVKSYSNVLLPKGLIIGDSISDRVTFDHLLKQVLDKPQFGRISTKRVVASLPESKSFVRVIQIPRMSDLEAESAVPFEAENFIPLPIDQVYLDWQKLGEVQDKMNILIIASPKDFVDSFMDSMEKSGLSPVALEVESQSCHRVLIDPAMKETSLIVDISSLRTSLIMVEDGNLQFTSTIPIAGNSFTESIARTLGVSASKAEMIKLKVGIANTVEYPNIKTALLPVLNSLNAEIKNILKFHNEHSGSVVNKIILSGGSAQLANLVEFLTPEFSDIPGLVVELGNPWKNIKKMNSSPLSNGEALSYTTAIGLALRGADFIP
jgi:type IV pilus assembly protein PilM